MNKRPWLQLDRTWVSSKILSSACKGLSVKFIKLFRHNLHPWRCDLSQKVRQHADSGVNYTKKVLWNLPHHSSFLEKVLKQFSQAGDQTQDLLFLISLLTLYRHATMEQCTLKNVNNYLNTNIYSYLETSGGQSYNLYLNVVHFFNTRVN